MISRLDEDKKSAVVAILDFSPTRLYVLLLYILIRYITSSRFWFSLYRSVYKYEILLVSR